MMKQGHVVAITMMMIMMTDQIGPAQAVVRATCPTHIRRWLMEQVLDDKGGGSWSVSDWVEYLTSFSTQERSMWMAHEEVYHNGAKHFFQTEEWEEWWATPDQANTDPLEWCLAYLNERTLLQVFRTAMAAARQALERARRANNRFSPY